MKKTLSILAICAVLLPSCKKSYSCACTVITTQSGTPIATSNVTEAVSEKLSSKQAKAACAETELQIEQNFKQQIGDPSITTDATCSVK
jgi:hypothetical protein